MTYLESSLEKARISGDLYENFRKQIKDYVLNNIAQGSAERSELPYLKKELIERLSLDGFLKVGLEPDLGGIQIDHQSIGIIFEEIAKVDFSATILILNHILINEMMKHVDDEVRKEWIPRFVNGEALICFANTEPDCGSDALAIKTKAYRDGDYYVIDGEKTSISLGMQAHVIVLTAKTSPHEGQKGITLFMVPIESPSIRREIIEDMGNLPIGRASFFFDQVRVPKRFLIGKEGEGFKQVMHIFNLSRVLVALSAVGMAQACLDEIINYAIKREIYGKPLSKYEIISFKIAEAKTFITASRLLCFHALKLRDKGIAHHEEAAMAKWFAPEQSVKIIHDLLLLLGWQGYTNYFRFEQRFRDAISTMMGDGTAEIMKLIIAREIFGKALGPEI